MIDLSEVEFTLLRLQDGRRVKRLVHLPTGTTVEEVVQSEVSVVACRIQLLGELEKRVGVAEASPEKRMTD